MHAHAAVSADSSDSMGAVDRLEQVGLVAIFGVAVALQFSIAAAQSLLAVAIACWLALVITRREPIVVPRFFWALAALAGATLLSAAFSPAAAQGFADSKQLLLFLVVPVSIRFLSGHRGATMVTVIVTAGAISAAYGIFQYGILDYNSLDLRVRGSLGHWMTYSGLLTLVIGVALARILFGERDRMWAALVMPALGVAIALTFTRTAMVAAFATVALLFILKDLRLLAILPVLAALFFAAAPTRITARFVSTFNMNDPTIRDRVAMLNAGRAMVLAHPLTGVGPTMVEARYPEFRDPSAVEPVVAHLHNVPMQIAAERGVIALAAWLAFVGLALVDLGRLFRTGERRMLAAVALAALVTMLAGGLFEYNFGDSEFLMLLLIVLSLPFAAPRSTPAHA